jgi:excisionase family DNA binding protein
MPLLAPPELPPHSYLTAAEIASYLKVQPRTIYRLIVEKQLPHVRWAEMSEIRIPREPFLEWYDRHGKSIV